MKLTKPVYKLLTILSICFAVGWYSERYKPLNSFKLYIHGILNPSISKKHKISPYQKDKISLFNKLEVDHSDALFIGDSLIDNGEWQEFFPKNIVINRGIQGITTLDLLNILPVLNHQNIPNVFVMIGINDLHRGINSNIILTNYSSIINNLVKNHEKVYVHSVLLSNSINNDLNEKIINLNNNIEKLTSDNENVIFIDLNKTISPDNHISEKYSFDGTHLNGEGYFIWVDTLKSIAPRLFI